MNVDALTMAIHAYFTGERSEGFAILAFSAGLVLVAAGLHAVGRDGFSRGFGVAAVLLALLLSSTVISLMRRDAPHQAGLVAALQSGEATGAVAAESSRMAEVIRKYPYYRIAALGFGVLGLAAGALSRRGWVNGAATGVLLLVIAQVMIDHYSEARATRYAGQLREALVVRP
jgi:hypothetical protein